MGQSKDGLTQQHTIQPNTSTTNAGVQVVTGVSWEEYYGTFAYYGAGLDYAVMAGVMVQTGATLNQWSGPIWGVREPVA